MSFSSQPGAEFEWVVCLPQDLCDRFQAAAVEDDGIPVDPFHISWTSSEGSTLTPQSQRTTSSHSMASVPPMEKGGPRSLHRTDSVLTLGPVRPVNLS